MIVNRTGDYMVKWQEELDKSRKKTMLYTYHSTGEQTTYGVKGPFTLGEIITMFEYVRCDKSSINQVATLDINESFVFGMLCKITRIESTEWNFTQYVNYMDKRAKDKNFKDIS
jgi:hypothetical protein